MKPVGCVSSQIHTIHRKRAPCRDADISAARQAGIAAINVARA
ncbi:hypothetical protein MYA_3831 [Burkholderia sp. KJ006]|nr:hypothetical protein MYA_3831 [Burkholderia sp. KJ006]